MQEQKPQLQQMHKSTVAAELQVRSRRSTISRAMDMLLKPLPADWQRKYDESGKEYFWNAVSNGIQYEEPSPLPYGWRIARDPASGGVYLWNYYTREVAPYEPVRKALGLATPRPFGDPPGITKKLHTPSSKPKSNGTTEASISESEDTLMCGLSGLKCAEDSFQDRYVCLSKAAMLRWFEGAEPDGNLKVVGSVDIRNLSAIKREAPESTRDFSFSIVLSQQQVVLDPGNRATFHRWEESLLTALSFPPRLRARRATCSEAVDEPSPRARAKSMHVMPRGPITADL